MRLLYAASQGDLDEMRAVLATGADPNAADYDGRTGLHLAASEGHLAAVNYLLAAGARPDVTDRWGGTPVTDAKRGKHTPVAELLTTQEGGEEPISDVLTELFSNTRTMPSEEDEPSTVYGPTA